MVQPRLGVRYTSGRTGGVVRTGFYHLFGTLRHFRNTYTDEAVDGRRFLRWRGISSLG